MNNIKINDARQDLALLLEHIDPFLTGLMPPCCESLTCENTRLRLFITDLCRRNELPLPSNLISPAPAPTDETSTSTTVWAAFHPDALDLLGIIPLWLSVDDPRPASQQLSDGYAHGGGWRPFGGAQWVYNWDNGNLAYPGDPVLSPVAACRLGDELISVYHHGLVCIANTATQQFEVARLD